MIDENLKVMVAGTIKEIKHMNVTNWKSILDYLDKIPYLEMMGERRNFSEDYIIIPKTEMLDFNDDFDHGTAFMIEVWFERLVRNYYILHEMNINITKLANFAAKGEKITVSNALIGLDKKHRALMDLAIIRFPDIMNPFFMVFTVQLIAYRESLRIIIIEHGSCGVLCRFNYARYKPNDEYIKNLREETKETLIRDINLLFDME
ncbi:uncharacterized protein LOC115228476 [Octopus sinensis]|uniref:Uncharacterized protein LOC115228476 n=1 Tax=Octopus sinensis TaxID=2607531 RepID=A0A6P7TYB9_9MOLL|nr:uncharacterized protein LOC115228476 [Octopus sinensis]